MQALLKNIVSKLPRCQNKWNVSSAGLSPSVNHQCNPSARDFSVLSLTNTTSNIPGFHSTILKPLVPLVSHSCGMKVRGLLKLRCKDCYFVTRDQRLYVMCKTHGRHKQMAMVPKPHNTWILTHATQGKNRGW